MKSIKNIFHVMINVNLMRQSVIQIKNGTNISVDVDVEIVDKRLDM